jgi:hypothetical protein
MSTVRKTVYVNPVEPSPLSFRCGARVETVLELTYYRQSDNDLTFNTDVDGQLRLTSRSSNRSASYSVPAMDISNGKARAIIPAGDVVDPNGYLLALYGTVNGEVGLLAKGLVFPNDYEAPPTEALDVVDTVPLTFAYATSIDTVFTVTLWQDTDKSSPYDLSASNIGAAIYAAKGGVKLLDMAVAAAASNSVTLTVTVAQVASLPANCWWSLRIGDVAGVTTLCEGPVTVT